MSNKVFQNIFKLEIDKMITESKYINPLKHNGVKGSIREFGLGNLFEKFLPNYLKVGSGIIHDKHGNQSNQSDLLIYNVDVLPPILFDKSLGIFPIESILYDIEIKTKSTANEIRTTISKFNNLKTLKADNTMCMTAYFAYDTDMKAGYELERYFKYDNRARVEPVVGIICVIGGGYYYLDRCRAKEANGNEYILNSWVGIEPNNNYEVLCFIGGVLNTSRNFSIGEYILDEASLKIFSQTLVDNNGNIIYDKIDFNGIAKNQVVEEVFKGMTFFR